MIRHYVSFLTLIFLFCGGCKKHDPYPSENDVVWNTPSDDSFGSMPLGNGDAGANVWTEKNGDIVMYISKVDAFDSKHCLPKLGRLRFRATPAFDVSEFSQRLSLADASVIIKAGDSRFRIWIDALNPVIRIEGTSSKPRMMTITLETIRPLESSLSPLPPTGTAGVLFEKEPNRIAWCYRNMSSVWAEKLKKQNTPGMVEKATDPLLHLTSGCMLEAAGFSRESPYTLQSSKAVSKLDCTVKLLSSRAGTVDEWLNKVSVPAVYDWSAHCAHWSRFWEKSYISIGSSGEGEIDLMQAHFSNVAQDSLIYEGSRKLDRSVNIRQINQRYALERFCQAAAGRSTVPAPFNGSIFTMDMPAGTHQFINSGLRKNPVNADNRDWQGLPIFWQNTRHPYWSMLSRGDFDEMMPAFKTILGTLETGRDRTRNLFGHEGAYMNEGIYIGGVSVFNDLPAHLRYHYLGTIEMTAVMCNYYEYTGDTKFLEAVLLPCADEFIKFYDLHYPRKDENGKRLIEPAGVAETYQPVTNPVTEVTALRFVLSKLLSFEEDITGAERRKYWSRLLDEMPDMPVRKIRGLELLAPGSVYEGRLICETPELYSVWPFMHASLGSGSLATGRQSFHLRQLSLDGTDDSQSWETGGWQSASVWAAYLGLPREAARLMSINFNDRFANFTYMNEDMQPPVEGHPRARFDAFWETKMDYTPDNDHGAVTVNALQSMLLQADGRKIFLLPAWPEDWDVNFRLHAPYNTTVECEYAGGRVTRLKITPGSRKADIIDMSSLENRIRNLIEVAQADRNYLFGLPPMLDAEPVPGKTTAEWISKYGYTLRGCKAGPWKNTVYHDSTVYLHVPGWNGDEISLEPISAKMVSFEAVTGSVKVNDSGNGFVISGTPDPMVTIVRMDFDRNLDSIANALPSRGSLTAGKDYSIIKGKDGMLIATFEPAEEITFSRIEFTIDNPGHIRGHGKPFILQVKEGNAWQTVYSGQVFGTIFGKAINPQTTRSVRLQVDAEGLKQFDLFE